MTFKAKDKSGKTILSATYFSVGGGFIVNEKETLIPDLATQDHTLPFASECAEDVLRNCADGRKISQIVMENELTWRSQEEIERGLRDLWEVMKASVYKGCHTEGKLPGGLDVTRRAFMLSHKLM